MKSSLAVVAVVLTVAIAGCDRRAAGPDSDAHAEAPVARSQPGVLTASPSVPDAAPVAPSTASLEALPHFAAVYPEAEVQGDPLLADGTAGPGGVVTFVTEASPDTVIAFYRERAEADGLATMMALNQGEARAYGAQKQATGASVNVVASPAEDRTSVQLTWSAGL